MFVYAFFCKVIISQECVMKYIFEDAWALIGWQLAHSMLKYAEEFMDWQQAVTPICSLGDAIS